MDGSVVVLGGAELAQPVIDNSLEHAIFLTARAALRNAGLEISDIDDVVIACSDQIDGRAISSMITSGPAGAHLRDEINLASSPSHAVAMAALRVLSGQVKRVLVSSWGKHSEGELELAEHLTTDPFFDRDIGLSEIAAMGMQVSLFRSRFPEAASASREVVLKNRHNASKASLRSPDPDSDRVLFEDEFEKSPIVAFPLKRIEIAQPIDGVCSIVIAAGEDTIGAGESEPIWLRGVGWASDGYRLGERSLLDLPHLRFAVSEALRRARLRFDEERIAFVEVDDYCADAELLTCQVLGLSDNGGLQKDIPVNASGGYLGIGRPAFSGGLHRFHRAVEALAKSSHENQADVAVVQSSIGFAGQMQTVFVLSRT